MPFLVFLVIFVLFSLVAFPALEEGAFETAVKRIMYTVIGVSVCAFAFTGGKDVSEELWGVDEQLAAESESDTGSVGDEADGGELVDSEKEDPGAGGGSSESGPPV